MIRWVCALAFLSTGCGLLGTAQTPDAEAQAEAIRIACAAFQVAGPHTEIPMGSRHEILEACAMIQAALDVAAESHAHE